MKPMRSSLPAPCRPPAVGGFSLLELLVAMAITVIVCGAMFGLIAGGNNAFRREPELTDRQQSIRIAMDLIERDVATAGVEMGQWAQTFSVSDSGVLLDGSGPLAPSGVNADALEIFGNSGECPSINVLQVVSGAGGAGGGGGGGGGSVVVRLAAVLPDCYQPMPGMVFFAWPGGNSIGFACDPPGGGGAPDQINFPPGQAPGVNWPGGGQLPSPVSAGPEFAPPNPTFMGRLQVIRYEVALEADGTPSLWRSTSGRASPTGNCGGGAGGAVGGAPGVGSGWQVVARGIEDLQVRYTMANGTIGDSPAVVAAGDYTTLVREVQVTLVGRVMKQRLQGETGGATGQFVRASLVSSVTPRAVLATLQGAPEGGPVEPWK